MAKSSIVREGVGGVIVLSGAYGSGKTTAALTLERPDLTVMIDLDSAKSESRCKALGMKYYTPRNIDLEDPTDVDLDKIASWLKQTFSTIKSEHSDETTIVIDNGSLMESVNHAVVAKSPKKYGVRASNVASGKYGGTNPGVGVIWDNTVRFLKDVGFQNIVVCMHMSQMWAGGAPIDKFRVKGNKMLTQMASLSLVLIKSPLPNTAPAAVVGKEALGLISWDEKTETHKVFMAVPPRIPEMTWPAVYEYIRTMRSGERTQFRSDEIPSVKEAERYGPWLSDAQRDLIMAVAKNPSFAMTESDAAKIVGRDPAPTNWDSLVRLLTPLGWTEQQIKDTLKERGEYDASKITEYWELLKNTRPTIA